MVSVHDHPISWMYRLTQVGAGLLIVVMLLVGVGQIGLALLDERARLLIGTGVFTLLLILPVIMLTTITPPVTVSPDALEIRPLIWPTRRVAWSDVKTIKEYPLLPPPESETGRKLLVGRKKYRPAEGQMLVIPSLPTPYKVGGFFCGEGFTPVIAITSRSHAEYAKLLKKVQVYHGDATANAVNDAAKDATA